MKKIIIGIVPTIHLNETDSPFLDRYEFVGNYSKSIYEAGAIPIGLLLNDGQINEEQLKLCDAFLFPGGKEIHPVLYDILMYAYEQRKPVLGICLGMQALAIFSCLLKDQTKTPKELEDQALVKLKDNFHHPIVATRTNLKLALHDIFIEPTSHLYSYYQDQIIAVYSFHDFAVNHISNMFKVTAFSDDGILEAIEFCDSTWLAIGVSFHTELEIDSPLIKGFINDVVSQCK